MPLNRNQFIHETRKNLQSLKTTLTKHLPVDSRLSALRSLHTLKGSAGFLQEPVLMHLLHQTESIYSASKSMAPFTQIEMVSLREIIDEISAILDTIPLLVSATDKQTNPINSTQLLSQRMEFFAHSTAKKINKTLLFQALGTDILMPEHIAVKMGMILLHLINNAVVHGLEEDTNIRIEQGKQAIGSIKLTFQQTQKMFTVIVSDDGQGLAKNKILKQANLWGIKTQSLTDDQIQDLIMMPGFSTEKKVHLLAGRGIGLDTVRSIVEELNGTIHFQSKKGFGTKVILSVQTPVSINQQN